MHTCPTNNGMWIEWQNMGFSPQKRGFERPTWEHNCHILPVDITAYESPTFSMMGYVGQMTTTPVPILKGYGSE